MQSIVAMIAVWSVAHAPFQDPQPGMAAPPPPKELGALGWLMGEWDADFKMYSPGGTAAVPVNGTVTYGSTLRGMYLESKYDADMGGVPSEGLQLTSYDAAKKQYFAYWFDSMAPGGLEFWGTLKGQTLTLVSKPFSMPGAGAPMVFRSTNSLKAAGKVLFRLEMKSGKGPFAVMMEGFMVRKGS